MVARQRRESDISRPVISVTHIIICIINRRVIACDRSKNGGKELARLRIARSLRGRGDEELRGGRRRTVI